MEQDAIKCGVSQEKDFFESLYHQYKYLMYKTAKYYTSNPAELEAIMQDSVERLLRNTHKLMDIPSCTQAAYLVYTVRSVAINLKRHQSVVAEHTLPIDVYEQDTYESPHLSPAEIVERLEHNQQLSALWSQLPEEDQELLYRKYVAEQSDEELSALFHCKKDSIRMKLTRARRKAIKLAEQEADRHGKA